MYYKQIENNIIILIGTSNRIDTETMIEISKADYDNLLSVVKNKPKDTLEYIYRLSAETNQYEQFNRTHEETVNWYFQKVANKEMIIDDVPEEYKEEVKAKLPNNNYGINDTTYNSVIDDYTMELVEKGVL